MRPQHRAPKIGSNLTHLQMAKLNKLEKQMFLEIYEKCTYQIEYGLEDTIAGSDDVPEEQPYIKADMEMLSHIKILNNWILTYLNAQDEAIRNQKSEQLRQHLSAINTLSKELNDLGLAVNIFDTEDEDNNVISNPVTLIAEISKPY
ncbi:hypothetical protein U1Q18_050176 [Sarracenia purpurea var. burkii]